MSESRRNPPGALAPVVWAVPTFILIHGLTRILVGLGELLLGR
jgi:hypothetical protein